MVFAAVGALLYVVLSDRQLKRMAAARKGEDIGSFARALDRRSPSFDPWVVRATWGALEPYMALRRQSAPDYRVATRPSDDLVSELRIDPDDLVDLVSMVSRTAQARPFPSLGS
ncbi:MAG: hypothetical protein GY722_17565 [bacterium]|nr:hypothetical protein [bacterium]